MKNSIKIMIIGLMLGTMILAGCTEPVPEDTGATEIPPQDTGETDEPAMETVEVTLEEFGVMPETITVSAGTVKFEVANSGNWKHEFAIEGTDVFESVPSGETRVVEVTLEAGTYKVTCPIPGHTEKGMEATLVVE